LSVSANRRAFNTAKTALRRQSSFNFQREFSMRAATFVASLVLLTTASGVAVAQQAPAPGAAGAAYNTATTPIGTLLDDPAAKAILVKYLPELASSPQIEQARALTLKDTQQYAPDKVTDQTLANIDAELARLPAKK
jgi:para-nitrobenzyl esterase